MRDGFDFPPGFLWGAATSAHQVEGGNVASDWWEYEEQGRVPFASGDACGHFTRYEGDFDLARAAGHNAHRLSLEWSRIEPAEGEFDEGALAHYGAVLDALRARGLEPVVTLLHFTLPAWFLRRGGWLRRDAPALFERFVARAARALGDRVRYWITINEPTVYALHGYVLGQWPPCRRGSWVAAGRVLRGLAHAHRRAYRALKHASPEARVGLAHSVAAVSPCDPQRRRDRLAARLRDAGLHDLFLRWIGARPGRSGDLDFLGVNYYTCARVRAAGYGLSAVLGKVCRADHHADRGPLGQTGWEVHPAGLARVLARCSKLGVPLLVSENGVATDDEPLRRATLRAHLEGLAAAVAAGAPVFGYLYWSLLDNFEWAMGTAPHFGLCAVDPVTLERRPRATLEDLAAVARSNRLPARAGGEGRAG